LRALPAFAAYPLRRDRGAVKGALLHAVLGGASRAQLDSWTDTFLQGLLRDGLYREALQAISSHRASGAHLLLMSASTDLYVPRIAQRLGFDECTCTAVRWRADGRLDGRLASANCRGEEKQRRLAQYIERLHPSSVHAYGDSAADLAHMRLAQHAYLINMAPGPGAPSGTAIQALHWHQSAGLSSQGV
jgi:phosphatidylglycerophosphatase C